jgi:hypothetical protein
MGMVVISSTVTVGPISEVLDADANPVGDAGRFLERSFSRLSEDLAWWMEAAKHQRDRRKPPY